LASYPTDFFFGSLPGSWLGETPATNQKRRLSELHFKVEFKILMQNRAFL